MTNSTRDGEKVVVNELVLPFEFPTTVETSPAGNLVVVLREQPIIFKQAFDPVKKAYKLEVEW